MSVEDHGTRSTYAAGCRCRECKKANRLYQQDYRRGVRQGRPRRTYESERKHGTRSKYVTGCRCDPCVEANRAYQRSYMKIRRMGLPWNDGAIEAAVAPAIRVRKKSDAAKRVLRRRG